MSFLTWLNKGYKSRASKRCALPLRETEDDTVDGLNMWKRWKVSLESQSTWLAVSQEKWFMCYLVFSFYSC